MQLYQLDYLISPQLSEQDAKNIGEKIKSLVKKEGGFIKKTEILNRQVLAYEIKNSTEAFLTGLSFNLEPEKLKIIKDELTSEKNIIRHLMFKKIIVRTKPVRKRTTKPLKEVKGVELKPKQKVELKEIEKKLEEILGDQ
ncbi:MAG: 30S ribosomal protein S6 [Patescibacteria group bacterium]|nr:30S ribosomal protein S6 [Patescibacteria group bacterium]